MKKHHVVNEVERSLGTCSLQAEEHEECSSGGGGQNAPTNEVEAEVYFDDRVPTTCYSRVFILQLLNELCAYYHSLETSHHDEETDHSITINPQQQGASNPQSTLINNSNDKSIAATSSTAIINHPCRDGSEVNALVERLEVLAQMASSSPAVCEFLVGAEEESLASVLCYLAQAVTSPPPLGFPKEEPEGEEGAEEEGAENFGRGDPAIHLIRKALFAIFEGVSIHLPTSIKANFAAATATGEWNGSGGELALALARASLIALHWLDAKIMLNCAKILRNLLLMISSPPPAKAPVSSNENPNDIGSDAAAVATKIDHQSNPREACPTLQLTQSVIIEHLAYPSYVSLFNFALTNATSPELVEAIRTLILTAASAERRLEDNNNNCSNNNSSSRHPLKTTPTTNTIFDAYRSLFHELGGRD